MTTTPPAAPLPVVERHPNLWAIILCTMGTFEPDAGYLDPDLIRLGYREWFNRKHVPILKQIRPYGLIVHLPRGLRADQDQSFALTANYRFRKKAAALRLSELTEALTDCRRYCSKIVQYEGPAPSYYASLSFRARQGVIADELGGVDSVLDHVIIDGAGGAAPGDNNSELLFDLDARHPRAADEMPFAGVESMATKDQPQNGTRISLTLAGKAKADGVTMKTGAYDPTIPPTKDRRLHPKFATLDEITAETIVLDLYEPTTDAVYLMRQGIIAGTGCSPCFPLWDMPRLPMRQGVRIATEPARA